jgi:TPR repeat protein
MEDCMIEDNDVLKRALAGDAKAMVKLGSIYKKEKDYEEAVKWYTLAAEKGDAHGQAYLGVLYLKGNGVSQNYKKAVYWFRKAADQDNVVGQNELGLCYEGGIGVPVNKEKAFQLYRLSAEHYFSSGIYNYGRCFYSGIGVNENLNMAVELLKHAESCGSRKAKKLLKRINEKASLDKKPLSKGAIAGAAVLGIIGLLAAGLVGLVFGIVIGWVVGEIAWNKFVAPRLGK